MRMFFTEAEISANDARLKRMDLEVYEEHPGPIVQGDLLVVQVNESLLPSSDGLPGPQWFIALLGQVGAEEIPLHMLPRSQVSPRLKARRYRCGWKP